MAGIIDDIESSKAFIDDFVIAGIIDFIPIFIIVPIGFLAISFIVDVSVNIFNVSESIAFSSRSSFILSLIIFLYSDAIKLPLYVYISRA